MKREIKFGLLFIGALLLTGAVIRVLAPPNPEYVWHPTLTVKLDHLSTTSEHYDVVFVGDSRVFRAINPAIVEAEMDALGCPANVFNMGAVAMTKYEFDEVMDVLDDAPAGTPEVIVTVDAMTLNVGLLKDFSVRQRVHMDIRTAAEYLTYRSSLPPDFGTGTVEMADMAAGYAVNQLPVGAIHQRLFSQHPLLDEEALVEEYDGFQPWSVFYEEAGPEGLENLFATLAPELENGGWERRWSDKAPGPEAVDDWITTISAHLDKVPDGATGVQLFIPSYYDAGTVGAIAEEWERRGRSEPLINLVDDAVVGDYTDPRFFIDYWHLSEAGSDAVSAAIGRQLCPIVTEAIGT